MCQRKQTSSKSSRSSVSKSAVFLIPNFSNFSRSFWRFVWNCEQSEVIKPHKKQPSGCWTHWKLAFADPASLLSCTITNILHFQVSGTAGGYRGWNPPSTKYHWRLKSKVKRRKGGARGGCNNSQDRQCPGPAKSGNCQLFTKKSRGRRECVTVCLNHRDTHFLGGLRKVDVVWIHVLNFLFSSLGLYLSINPA